LIQFVRDKKRVGCPVCSLSDTIRSEIESARTRKIGRPEVIEWLKAEYKVTISRAQFDAHHSGRHEQAD
jgi:hypothetical protein